jgi:hypothetical protein
MPSRASGAHRQRADDHDAHDRGTEDQQEKRDPDSCHDGERMCRNCQVRRSELWIIPRFTTTREGSVRGNRAT